MFPFLPSCLCAIFIYFASTYVMNSVYTLTIFALIANHCLKKLHICLPFLDSTIILDSCMVSYLKNFH